MTTEERSQKCVHFTGIQHERCGAGVDYKAVRDSDKSPYRWPCLTLHGEAADTTCDKRLLPTAAEVKAEEEKIERILKADILAFAAVDNDCKAHGLGKGHGGQGSVACPVCKSGTITYSVAEVNGHRHARCTTAGCVRFME